MVLKNSHKVNDEYFTQTWNGKDGVMLTGAEAQPDFVSFLIRRPSFVLDLLIPLSLVSPPRSWSGSTPKAANGSNSSSNPEIWSYGQ